MTTKKKLEFRINPLLSGPSFEVRQRSGSPYREINISDIDVDPEQPRRVFDTEKLTELAESIKEYGVLCPILVRVAEGGTYRLVAGERRLRASKLAGKETIPAVIDSSEPDANNTLGRQLVENMQRADLTPMERAMALGQLKERNGWSVREIASHLSVSKSLVQRSLELLELPDDLQAALIAGASESKILMLSKVGSREMRKALIPQLEELSRAELELVINGGQKGQSRVSHGGTAHGRGAQDRRESRLSAEDKRVIEEIQKSLGLKAHLLRSKKKEGQGRIVLDFYSSSDLYEVYRKLTA